MPLRNKNNDSRVSDGRKLILFAMTAMVMSVLAISSTPSASALYVFKNMWGEKGTGNGQFDSIGGIAVFSSGNVFPSIDVFVVDTLNDRVQKFHMSNPCPTGTTQVVVGVCFVTKWGTHGSGPGQFNQPRGIDLDSSGNVFVADALNHRIQKFTFTGTFIREWGQFGTQNGQFRFPNDVAVNREGNVFVADIGNDRTQKFTNTGGFIRSWGTTGTGDGQFEFPHSLAVAETGNVFVTERENHRIQKFSNTGTFLAKTLPNDLGWLNGIGIDPTGKVYATDGQFERIKEFTNDLHFISGWGQFGHGPGQWAGPTDLDIVTPGLTVFKYVYVVDFFNNRVQIYFWEPDVHPNISKNYTSTTNYTGANHTNGTTNMNKMTNTTSINATTVK